MASVPKYSLGVVAFAFDLVLGLKIGQVLLYYPPVMGGIELFLSDLSRGLVVRGHEVHIFTLLTRRGGMLGPKYEVVDGVHIHRISPWLDLSYRLKFWPELVKEILQTKLDVVHAYCQGHFHTLAALFASKSSGHLPFVITTYGPLAKQSNYHPAERALLSLYDLLVTSQLFRMSDMVVARNPGVTSWLRNGRVNALKTAETAMGIPSTFLDARVDGNNARSCLGVSSQKVVLYLGRISQQKGLDQLVRAIPFVRDRFPNCLFLLVGPDEGFKLKLKELANSLGVSGNVRFEGQVSGIENELTYYGSCDLFVMPSSFEGFGQAVVKAMACGKPVIASSVGALPFLIADGVNGKLFRFGDVQSLSKAIVELMKSDELSATLGANARETVRNFRFENVVEGMETVYEMVLRR